MKSRRVSTEWSLVAMSATSALSNSISLGFAELICLGVGPEIFFRTHCPRERPGRPHRPTAHEYGEDPNDDLRLHTNVASGVSPGGHIDPHG